LKELRKFFPETNLEENYFRISSISISFSLKKMKIKQKKIKVSEK